LNLSRAFGAMRRSLPSFEMLIEECLAGSRELDYRRV
jgi:hypothetical protein